MQRSSTRRDFLRTGAASGAAAVAAACAPAAAPPVTPAGTGGPRWEQQWEEAVAGAKREGQVAVLANFASAYDGAIKEFEKAYPGVSVEIQGASGMTPFIQRVITERKGGVYYWDVAQIYSLFGFTMLTPEGALTSVRPAFILPEVTVDEAWYGGFEFGFLDNAKQNSFSIGWEKQLLGYVNYDLVGENELKTPQDLLNPKWRGKIGFARNSGGTHLFAMVIRNKLGDDAVKQFFIDQDAVLTTDTRVLTEDLVRGKYAIAGADSVRLRQLQAEGLGKNVKRLDIPDFTMIRETGVHLFERAPHPNAAKVFINWLLSKEGQRTWSKAGQYNSRRKDVPTFWEDLALNDGDEKRYVRANIEETLPKVVAAQELYEKLIK